MNTLRELDQRCAALTAEVAALRQLIESAKAQRDPFAADIYAARQSLRSAIDHDPKSGHRSERQILLSDPHATQEFGYQGGLRDWETVLRTKLFGSAWLLIARAPSSGPHSELQTPNSAFSCDLTPALTTMI